MEIKNYALSDEIKKQLGCIIREKRKIKFQKYKDSNLIENNPFTKENFCENNLICHYHTLTKLETDLIKEDAVYHKLLHKLGYYYQISRTNHKKNLNYLESLIIRVLDAGEYINDELAMEILNEIKNIDYKNDVIAYFHLELIKLFIKLQLVTTVNETTIEFMNNFTRFYTGVYQGLAHQCLGIYYLNQLKIDRAQIHFLTSQKIYNENNISKGLISSYLISVYVHINNYYESVPLCNEMEVYYKKTNNYKRLMHVYNYLSEYHFLINAHDVAKDYFDKAIEIVNKDNTLERYKFSLHYNWGFRCFKEYRLQEALDNFIIAFNFCGNNSNKLHAINLIIILMTKLNYSEEEINKYYNEGEKDFSYSNELNQNIFKYFRFKFRKSKYYRKYAHEKIIPMLSDDRSKNEILLFFYEDLYK